MPRAASAAPCGRVPADRAEALLHVYDGGGTRAIGPAVLVRKSLKDKVSLSGTLYVDMVSNASIDVVTAPARTRSAAPRSTWGWTMPTATRLTLGLSSSSEPDYRARALSVDVAQDFFGAMSTLKLGFTRGADDVGKTGVAGVIDQATHWQYRLGLTQVLSPRWLASVNVEALADNGLLGSPYRVARVFGAAVPERLPRTRSARAVRLSTRGDVDRLGGVVKADYRWYSDTWGLRAHTLRTGHARQLKPGLDGRGQPAPAPPVGRAVLQRRRGQRDALRHPQPPARRLHQLGAGRHGRPGNCPRRWRPAHGTEPGL
jgi:hypothetical protein